MVAIALGALHDEYRNGRAFALKALLLGPAVMLLGLGGIAALVLLPPDPRADFWTMAVCWSLALGLASLGGLLPIYWFSVRSLRIQVYEHGIVQVVRGKRIQVLWDEVERLRIEAVSVRMNGIPAGSMRIYRVGTSAGEQLRLNSHLDGIEKLGAELERQVWTRLGPRVKAELDAGRTVTFGPLSLRAVGVAYKDDLLPWARLGKWRMQVGFIDIFERGTKRRFAHVRFANVPNAHLLLSELTRRAANSA